jgi:hypothetical protein
VTDELTVDEAVEDVEIDDLRPRLHPMALSHRDDIERLEAVLA